MTTYGMCTTIESARAAIRAAQRHATRGLHIHRVPLSADDLASISGLHDLRDLTLTSCSVGPDGALKLAGLVGLARLDLSGNPLGNEGVGALSALTRLRSLEINSVELGDLGVTSLSALAELRELFVAHNNVGDDGARALSELSSLQHLNLLDNHIGDEGAHSFCRLAHLKTLDLEYNQIGAAGASALLNHYAWNPEKRRLLVLLDLRHNAYTNADSTFPADLVGSTSSAPPLLAGWRRFRNATRVPLNEARVLVVGNEAVGKTSLIAALIDGRACDPHEGKTRGTAIHERIETRDWPYGAAGILLHVWDFGGQEILHGTHRYFLSRRCLYILVLEDRREDDRSVFDWLRTIRSRGGDSPILVVVNKCDDPGRQDLRLDRRGLVAEFPQVVGVLRTSCKGSDAARATIQELKTAIANVLDGELMRHIRDPLPMEWIDLKAKVAELSRRQRVLPSEGFRGLCGTTTPPITDPDEQQLLLGMLHDLGAVVAHGLERDAPAVRREVTLLDPNWLTRAIYDVLNHVLVMKHHGELDRGTLSTILDPAAYPPERHEFVLDMMRDPEIGLCFELPNTGGQRFLIPERLPDQGPALAGWQADALRFRVRYALLRPGLMPRFLVVAHELLTSERTWWRRGAVLEAAGCPVLIRADLDRRWIDVAVAGRAELRRAALHVVLERLALVHEHMPEAEPKEHVPLPDMPEVDVPYEHLLKLEQTEGGEHAFLPIDGNRKYTVRELLEGVRHTGNASSGIESKAEPLRTIQEVALNELLPTRSRWLRVAVVAVLVVVGTAIGSGFAVFASLSDATEERMIEFLLGTPIQPPVSTPSGP